MEEAIIQRINYLIDNSGKTKNLIATEIGMSSTTVWRQLKGEQALSARLIKGILDVFPDVSAEWLLRGNGDGFCENEKGSVWKTRYEVIKECYDALIARIGNSGIQNR